MEWLTPKLLEMFVGYAREGGLAFTLFIVLCFLGIEIKRSRDKDKIIAEERKVNREFQEKMQEITGEMKTAVSNGNLLLEMLVRGRQ